jgi:Protein of unknown function (DUF2846)
MMRRVVVLSLFLVVHLLLTAPAVRCQSEADAPVQQKTVAPVGSDLERQTTKAATLGLQDGTPVRLRFVRQVVSSEVIAGDKVMLEVVEPVILNGLTAIPAHSSAQAMVTVAQARSSVGHGGNLEIKLETVCLADGEDVALRAVQEVREKDSRSQKWIAGGMVVGAGLPGLVAASLLKGKNAEIPAGTEMTAYINGNFALDATKFTGTSQPPQDVNVKNSDQGPHKGPLRLEALACADSDPMYSQHTENSPQTLRTPTAGKGLVYVIRPTHIGMWSQTKLAVDRRWVGTNRKNNYFYFELDPGPHHFCSEGDNRSVLSLVVEAGKTYYLQQKMEPAEHELQLLDEQEGKEGLAKCKRSVFEPKNKNADFGPGSAP